MRKTKTIKVLKNNAITNHKTHKNKKTFRSKSSYFKKFKS